MVHVDLDRHDAGIGNEPVRGFHAIGAADWKIDCSKPAGNADASATMYVMREGKLFQDRDFGNIKDSGLVVSAKTMADASIVLVVNFASLSQTREYSLAKGQDGRIRAIFSRNVQTNEYTVKDGKLITNGSSLPRTTLCR